MGPRPRCSLTSQGQGAHKPSGSAARAHQPCSDGDSITAVSRPLPALAPGHTREQSCLVGGGVNKDCQRAPGDARSAPGMQGDSLLQSGLLTFSRQRGRGRHGSCGRHGARAHGPSHTNPASGCPPRICSSNLPHARVLGFCGAPPPGSLLSLIRASWVSAAAPRLHPRDASSTLPPG